MPIEPPLPLLPAAIFAVRAQRVALRALAAVLPDRPEYAEARAEVSAAGELLDRAVAQLERHASQR